MQPEAPAHRLRAALKALNLLPAASSEQRALTDALLQYVALMAKWNRTYNLTAVRDPSQMLVQHIFDSAAVVQPLRGRVEQRRGKPEPGEFRPRIIDVGSGAGLPGIVLALLWGEADILLVEPVAKKAAFLQQAVTELSLVNATVVRSRVEDLSGDAPQPDAVICRAFASLAEYAKAVDALVGPQTIVAAMKAQLEPGEKSALTPKWRIAAELPLQVPELAARRSLVLLERTDDAASPAMGVDGAG